MIILFSALAVIAAAVVLVIGMISGAFALVYAGLALAGGGVVLLLIARYLRRSRHAALPAEPAPLAVSPSPASADEVGLEVDDPTSAFPIARYDSLWVTQIVPQLVGLSADELVTVDARERGGRHRTGVLDAIAAVRRGDEPVVAEPASIPDADAAAGHDDPGDDDPEVGNPPIEAEAEAEIPAIAPLSDDAVPSGRVATFLGRPAAPIHVHRP